MISKRSITPVAFATQIIRNILNRVAIMFEGFSGPEVRSLLGMNGKNIRSIFSHPSRAEFGFLYKFYYAVFT